MNERTLEELLRDRPFEQIPLRVTSGILLHIGAGIYNSAAGAIKELVSNSFDADATRVVISTDYPNFEQIKVADNGHGMTQSYFAKAMQSIGSSLKGVLEPTRLTAEFNRPVIGHMGIGLMALTQVCDEATIESQIPNAETKFIAKLDFSEFRSRKKEQIESAKIDIFRELAARYGGVDAMRQRLDDLDSDTAEYVQILGQLELATDAENAFEEQGIEETEGEHLGYCTVYPDLPATPGHHGTSITLDKIDEGVRSALRDQARSATAMPPHRRGMSWSKYRSEVNDWSWEKLGERLRLKTSQLSYQSLPKYHQFLWELAAMTPVQYFDEAPVLVEPDLLRWKKVQLDSFNFTVLVDNRRLLKPILLPSGTVAREEELEREYDYHVETFSQDELVDGEPLKYRGYVFWQRQQVEPSALRGLHTYIRNVGIGLYDQTLLGFSNVNPTSRAGQLSGEIYVEEGLEQALSVDRNSFRETDAHYVALQEHIWELLGSTSRGDGILGISVDAYWRRRERREEHVLRQHVQRLAEQVTQVSKGRFVLEFSEEDNPQPYAIEDGHITVYDESPRWPRSRSTRLLYQQVMIPVKAAVAAGASPEQVLDFLEKTLLKA